jgi:uncharacterized phosphosugar-binding protein
MPDAPSGYLSAVRRILEHIETTQLPVVERAAALVTDRLTAGGAVWCGDIGHGNEGDFLNRAGGLACLHKFGFGLSVNDPIADCRRNRPRPEPVDVEAETVRCALRASQMRLGDVLLLSSVSGKNTRPVEIAIACREMGIHVIGLTSLPYTGRVESLHTSGHKLCDAAEIVLDIGAPYGDAAVAIEGYPCDLLPVSGVAMIVLGWCLWGRVMELLAARGTPASVFMSFNRDGGPEFYEQQSRRYQEQGF